MARRVLLAGVVAPLFFTGTVLKWDQESVEALEHNIEIGKLLGRFGFWFSPSIGGIPIRTRLYVVHIGAAVPVHARDGASPAAREASRAGGVALPKGPEREPTRPFSQHMAELGALSFVLIGVLTILAVLAPPFHGPAPVEGIEVTKPPWPMLWIYRIEDWVGVAGILWGTVAIFLALLLVPFVDRGPDRHPRKRLPMMVAGAFVVVTIISPIVWAAVQPVASHIGMG